MVRSPVLLAVFIDHFDALVDANEVCEQVLYSCNIGCFWIRCDCDMLSSDIWPRSNGLWLWLWQADFELSIIGDVASRRSGIEGGKRRSPRNLSDSAAPSMAVADWGVWGAMGISMAAWITYEIRLQFACLDFFHFYLDKIQGNSGNSVST